MSQLSYTESLHSKRNELFFRLRTAVKFRRAGYREEGAAALELSTEERRLEMAYSLSRLRASLSPETYRKNLATLWLLETCLSPHLARAGSIREILEPGSQDFSRLPALAAFFRKNRIAAGLTALELDPFPVLQGFHSRLDKAEYFRGVVGDPSARFFPADFFRWAGAHDLVLSFYPFVSPHPALAWGIPAGFGNARKWVDAYARNLRTGGLVLVVHQGDWEEEEFDEARAGAPLELLARRAVELDFYPLPHPACVSVYRRT